MARLSDFDYELPEELIAQRPLAERPDSRLLVVSPGEGAVSHARFREFPSLIRPGDCLVLNDTRVINARLIGRRPTGGGAEALLIRPLPDGDWEALCRPASRLKPGIMVDFDPTGRERLTGEVVAHAGEGLCVLRLHCGGPFEALLNELGHVPLPPYIRRPDDPELDRERYQTVYARRPGAVAAPTAGLHFTQDVLAQVAARGAEVRWITLHVGPGTFRPVTTERIEDHVMHAEAFSVPEETSAAIDRTRAAGGRVVAVGTTTVRALEAVAHEDGSVPPGAGETALFIRPGYRFRAIDALLTNFHLPRSTLLMLVYALSGVELGERAYAEAVAQRYRFYSYGDAMFIE